MTENENGNTRAPFKDLTLDAKIARNSRRLNDFKDQGVPVEVSSLRIGTLLEVLLGDRLQEAETLVQDRLDQALDEVDRQLGQAKEAAEKAATAAKIQLPEGLTG